MSFHGFNYRKIIADAWRFTRGNKRLMMWYSFVPALLTTLIGILYIGYQFFAFKRSALFDNAEHGFLYEFATMLLDFFTDHRSLAIPTITIAIIILLLYLLLPTLAQGGLIQIIARTRKNIHVRLADGISFGMLVFLPLFEYHLFIRIFSFFSIFSEGAFVIRNLGLEALRVFTPFFVTFLILGLILTLLFTYTEFFIVLERKGVLASVGNSCKLMILNWQHTFLISILMLIIGVRIIVNIIAVLLVPALIILSTGLIATITLAKIGIVIGVLVGIVALILASYLNAIIDMFANTVWTFTFLSLREEKKSEEFIE